MDAWKLYYDGGCNFCDASQVRAVKWAKAAHQPIETDFLQGPDALAKGYDLSGVVIEANGQVFQGADAGLLLLRIAPPPLRWFAWMANYRFTRWLAKVGYAVIARVRYRIFGRKACVLPDRKG